MEKQGKRALPRSAWPHDLAGFEIIDDQLSFPKNLMIRQGQYQHLRSSSPSLRWDDGDEKILNWHHNYDFSHFWENLTLIFCLQYFKKLFNNKKIMESTKFLNLLFFRQPSTNLHITTQQRCFSTCFVVFFRQKPWIDDAQWSITSQWDFFFQTAQKCLWWLIFSLMGLKHEPALHFRIH